MKTKNREIGQNPVNKKYRNGVSTGFRSSTFAIPALKAIPNTHVKQQLATIIKLISFPIY